jgi:hypothetical protein
MQNTWWRSISHFRVFQILQYLHRLNRWLSLTCRHEAQKASDLRGSPVFGSPCIPYFLFSSLQINSLQIKSFWPLLLKKKKVSDFRTFQAFRLEIFNLITLVHHFFFRPTVRDEVRLSWMISYDLISFLINCMQNEICIHIPCHLH